MSKPAVLTKCVANYYAAPNERIIEVSSRSGGCLARLWERDGMLHIHLYGLDPNVKVTVGDA